MLQHQPSTPFTFDSVDRLVGAENKKKSKSKKVDERQIAIFDDREAGITMKPKKLKVATRSPRALLASSNVSLNQISPRPEIRVQKMPIKKQSEIKEPKIVGQEMRIEQKKSKRLPFIQKDHNVPQPRVFKPMPTRTDKLLDILTVPVFGLANRNSAEPTEIVGTERLEQRQMPSVGKVLQATMPDSSRRALMKWKLTKIAELGEDGFNELQRCILYNIQLLVIKLYLNNFIFNSSKSICWIEIPFRSADLLPDQRAARRRFIGSQDLGKRRANAATNRLASRTGRSSHRSSDAAV